MLPVSVGHQAILTEDVVVQLRHWVGRGEEFFRGTVNHTTSDNLGCVCVGVIKALQLFPKTTLKAPKLLHHVWHSGVNTEGEVTHVLTERC